jgi:hypothetical protein
VTVVAVAPPLLSDVAGRRWSFADADAARRRYSPRVLLVAVDDDFSGFFWQSELVTFDGDRLQWRLLALDYLDAFAVVIVGTYSQLPTWCFYPVVAADGVVFVESNRRVCRRPPLGGVE